MEITDEMIERLAHLARLNFNDEEKDELKHDLARMINFVEKLKEVDTSGVQPLTHILDAENIMREDEVIKRNTKEEAIMNAPLTDGNFFMVPKIIRRETE